MVECYQRQLAPKAGPEVSRDSASELARRLAPDEAILEYHVGIAASWLFVITPQGLTVSVLPAEAALRKQIDELRGLRS